MRSAPLLRPSLLFAAVIVMITAVGIFAHRNLDVLVSHFDRVGHSHDVLSQLGTAVEASLVAETASRGFFMTGEDRFLDEYRTGRDHAREAVRALAGLVGDNPAQMERVAELAQAIEDKMTFLEVLHGLALRAPARADSLRSLGRGAELLEAVASRAGAIRAEESRLLAERNARASMISRRTVFALLALVTAAIALSVVVYVQFARAVTRQIRAAGAERTRAGELAESDRRKDEFLAILGHELRNPLAPIHMALHVLDSDTAPLETVGRAREILNDQVRLMTRIVDEVMDASRISLGKIRLEPEPVDLGELMRSVAEGMRPVIEERGNRLEIHPPQVPVEVTLDPGRTRQVLHNLLVNASKYTGPGGHITFTGTVDAHTVTLKVLDDGLGLTAAQIAHIFRPFAQAEAARSHADGGLGIELTLARNLVELHGGTIEAASPGPGRGSAFTVRIPRAGF